MIQPFPYQEVGSGFLAGRRRALLLDAPGLGKTLQAITAADLIGAESMDVVCPASVVKQWEKAYGAISADCDHRVFRSFSYEHARDKGISRQPAVICLDEVHYLRNAASRRTQALFGSERYGRDGLIFRSEYVWGMTGTPTPRDPSNLFPAMNAIVPGSLALSNGRTMDMWQFLRKFCDMYDSGYGMVVRNGKNLKELADRLAPFSLRRTKKEVMKDWKEPVIAELWLDADNAAAELAKLDATPEGQEISAAFRKGGFAALKQLAKVDKTGISRYRRFVGLMKVRPVVKWLTDEFNSGLERIVVICVHSEVIASIAEKLREQEIACVVYEGGMTTNQKDAAKAAFLKMARGVFIGQIVAAGTGVDGLQAATGRMLLVEYSWIDDDNYQVICRLDRIGQQEPVLGQFVGLEGSLDGSIMRAAARRAKENKELFG